MVAPRFLVYADTKTRRVSEKVNSRLLECGRLRGFEASGCRLARLAHGGRYQGRYQARCKGRLQWSIYACEGCDSMVAYC
jgi:hypothetical protein